MSTSPPRANSHSGARTPYNARVPQKWSSFHILQLHQVIPWSPLLSQRGFSCALLLPVKHSIPRMRNPSLPSPYFPDLIFLMKRPCSLNGVTWHAIECHGVPWRCTIGFRGNAAAEPWRCHGGHNISWKPMLFYFMGGHGPSFLFYFRNVPTQTPSVLSQTRLWCNFLVKYWLIDRTPFGTGRTGYWARIY